ncbi:hypothetical protein ACFOW1_01755 [Parasediminibacterium paludis]|uniref:Uncharacterized protein n=1 Tax=Parasediminibacterium paludis TaxID=908966 RepID=A0ABV8PRB0_9BACT
MITIAKNTTASENLISKLQTGENVKVYNCFEDECDQIDLIFIDNGSKESFTLDVAKSYYGEDRNFITINALSKIMRAADGYPLEDVNF